MAEIKVQRESRSGNWIWVVLVLLAIAAFLFFAFPGADNRTANRPGGATSTSGAGDRGAPANPGTANPPAAR